MNALRRKTLRQIDARMTSRSSRDEFNQLNYAVAWSEAWGKTVAEYYETFV